jgi:TonB family protein
MFRRTRIAGILAVIGCGFPIEALASTVVVAPEVTPEGMTPPMPMQPLNILDTDYPLESLLGADAGHVRLNLIVDVQGKITAARVLTPSGIPRLDQQAIDIARTRWQT